MNEATTTLTRAGSWVARTVKFESDYPHRVAVFVAGETPQVITETLCMIMREDGYGGKPGFFPTEVHIITTRGKEGKDGHELKRKYYCEAFERIAQCIKQYRVAYMKNLGQSETAATPGLRTKVHLRFIAHLSPPEKKTDWVADPPWRNLDGVTFVEYNTEPRAGTPDMFSDLRTADDNRVAADYIARVVQQLRDVHDTKLAIHASIAGGRKTMGAYLNNAMWLLGRDQDEISHVLVHPDFEASQCPSFYFVAPDKANEVPRSTEQLVMLSPMPFARLGCLFPRETFVSETVSLTRLASLAQGAVAGVDVEIDVSTKRFLVGGIEYVKLGRQQFALLAWLAMFRKYDDREGITDDQRGWILIPPSTTGGQNDGSLKGLITAWFKLLNRVGHSSEVSNSAGALKLEAMLSKPDEWLTRFGQLISELQRVDAPKAGSAKNVNFLHKIPLALRRMFVFEERHHMTTLRVHSNKRVRWAIPRERLFIKELPERDARALLVLSDPTLLDGGETT